MLEIVSLLVSYAIDVYKRYYSFCMNIMEEVFELYRNFGKWFQNLHNWSVYVLQLIKKILQGVHTFKR